MSGNSPPKLEGEGLLTYSEDPATNPYPEPQYLIHILTEHVTAKHENENYTDETCISTFQHVFTIWIRSQFSYTTVIGLQ